MDDTDDRVVGEAQGGVLPGDAYGAGDDTSVLDDLREMPVGTNDPNIVGNVGPVDVPPGTDPRGSDELLVTDDQRPTEADDEFVVGDDMPAAPVASGQDVAESSEPSTQATID